MLIRKYKKEDYVQIKELISDVLKEIFSVAASDLEDIENIPVNFELFLVAIDKEKIVGTIGLKNEEGIARISRMYIHKYFRKKGLGKKLIEKIIVYCKNHKFQKIILTTYPQMNSKGFYEKMGFMVFKRDERIWMKRNLG